ncbi:MAG: Hpt domain-containing protein, partial [Burkholderiaceae bacterium]
MTGDNPPFDMPPDLSVLSWCVNEIKQSLQAAVDGLRQRQTAGPDDADALAAARAAVHQAHGALAIVGLSGVPKVTAAAERFVEAIESAELALDPAATDVFGAACAAVAEYLDALLAGEPHQPLYLYPYYRDLLQARGAARIHPADLLVVPRPAGDLCDPPPVKLTDPAAIAAARGGFERSLLKLMRDPADRAALTVMRTAVDAILHTARGARQPVFWRTLLACFDGWLSGKLAIGVDAKRLLARTNLQIRHTLVELLPVADGLLAEALFLLAGARDGPAQVDRIRAAFQLDQAIPADYAQRRYGTVDPAALDEARKALVASRQTWENLSGGPVAASARLEVAKALTEAAQRLPAAGLQRLSAGLLACARAAASPEREGDEALALEAAGALLFAEQFLEQGVARAGALDAHAIELGERLDEAARDCAALPALPEWMRTLGQAAHERLTMATFVAEARVTLEQAERVLDTFFRDQSQHSELPVAVRQLRQIGGALSLLGHQQASLAAEAVARQVAGFAERAQVGVGALVGAGVDDYLQSDGDVGLVGGGGDLPPDDTGAPEPIASERFEDVAASLGALGFFIDGLVAPEHGSIGVIFDPDSGRIEASVEVAVARRREATPASEPIALPEVTETRQPDTATPPEGDAEADPAGVAPEPGLSAAVLPQAVDPVQEAADPVQGAAPTQLAAPAPAAAPPLLDAEMLEIFFSEAVEVLDDIEAAASRLREAPSAHEPLVDIRRGFHTLKGSGRMVGLTGVGEAGWAMEKVANTWLGESRAVNGALHDLIELVAALLRGWVGMLASNPTITVDPAPVVAAANAVTQGRASDEALAALVAAGASLAIGSAEPLTVPLLAGRPADRASLDESRLSDDTADVSAEAVDTFEAGSDSEPEPALEPAFEFERKPEPEPELEPEPEPAFEFEPEPEPEPAFEFEPEPEPEPDIEAAIAADLAPAPATDVAPAAVTDVAPAAVTDAAPAVPVEPESAQAEPEAPAAQPALVRIGSVELSRELYEIFLDEADELVATVREDLAAWLGAPTRMASESALRAMHSLKGSTSVVGLAAAHQVAQRLENFLRAQRTAGRAAAPEDLDDYRRCVESIEAMLHRFAAGQQSFDDGSALALAHQLAERWTNPAALAVPSATAPAAAAGEQESGELDADLLPIFVEEAVDILPQIGENLRRWQAEPNDRALQQLLMRQLHTIKGSARMAGAMVFGQHVHEMETRVEAASGLTVLPSALIDDLVAEHDIAMDRFEAIRENGVEPPAQGSAADPSAVGSAVGQAQADAAQATAVPSRAGPSAAVTERLPQAANVAAPAVAQAGALVRVRADLLDRLVNESGEVSISRARVDNELAQLRQSLQDLTENVGRLRGRLREIEIQAESQIQAGDAQRRAHESEFDPLEFDRYTRFQELTRMLAEAVDDVATVQQNAMRSLDGATQDMLRQARTLRDLQQNLMRMRMVPFGSISDRLYRVVRQAAKELGKRVSMDLRGASAEIDRGVLERMAAPIEHLLRNAVAHGIEAPSARLAAGKAEAGEIRLEVSQEGNEVVLVFADDGAGLDIERIRSKAATLGLVADTDSLSEAAVADLIFVPGFSTAGSVDEISGRGVGLDAVRTEVASLGGRIDIETRRGEGARFIVHLPLTLAIAQVVLVGVGPARYAIASSSVEQVLQLKPQALAEAYARGSIDWQGGRVPVHYLGALLGARDVQPVAQHQSPIVVIRSGKQRLAVHVDSISPTQEIVVKHVGAQVARVPGIGGATVLSNG